MAEILTVKQVYSGMREADFDILSEDKVVGIIKRRMPAVSFTWQKASFTGYIYNKDIKMEPLKTRASERKWRRLGLWVKDEPVGEVCETRDGNAWELMTKASVFYYRRMEMNGDVWSMYVVGDGEKYQCPIRDKNGNQVALIKKDGTVINGFNSLQIYAVDESAAMAAILLGSHWLLCDWSSTVKYSTITKAVYTVNHAIKEKNDPDFLKKIGVEE